MNQTNFRNNLKINRIITIDDLSKAFDFLRPSNMLSNNQIYKFQKYLIKFNRNIEYGFTLVDEKNNICGIMLTFEQGHYKVNNQVKYFGATVVSNKNLQTSLLWCSRKKIRGLAY